MAPTTFGRQVRRLREERGWSQTELAAKADMSQSVISGIETGFRDNPNLDTITRLAYALGVKPSVLLVERKGA